MDARRLKEILSMLDDLSAKSVAIGARIQQLSQRLEDLKSRAAQNVADAIIRRLDEADRASAVDVDGQGE